MDDLKHLSESELDKREGRFDLAAILLGVAFVPTFLIGIVLPPILAISVASLVLSGWCGCRSQDCYFERQRRNRRAGF